jgi:hypothetical protein
LEGSLRINAKRTIAVTFTIALSLAVNSCSLTKNKATAEQAVTKFHNQLNVGQFRDIYVQSHEGFKKGTNEADAVALFEAIHRKLGLVQKATATSWRVNTTPMGTLTVLTYDVDFTEGKAMEQFAFQVKGETALLFSYNVNSPLLITK